MVRLFEAQGRRSEATMTCLHLIQELVRAGFATSWYFLAQLSIHPLTDPVSKHLVCYFAAILFGSQILLAILNRDVRLNSVLSWGLVAQLQAVCVTELLVPQHPEFSSSLISFSVVPYICVIFPLSIAADIIVLAVRSRYGPKQGGGRRLATS